MKIKKISKYSLVAVLFLSLVLFLKTPSFANGGDQRVVEGKYLINLSRSPFTPTLGDKTSMLASFVDIKTDKLIAEDLIVKIRIAKLGPPATHSEALRAGEGRERKFLFEQENLITKRGILEFQYTFTEPGMHEIFFDFAFATNPQKIYSAPDFLLDIQKASIQGTLILALPLGIVIGAILGFVGGWFIKNKKFSQGI